MELVDALELVVAFKAEVLAFAVDVHAVVDAPAVVVVPVLGVGGQQVRSL